MTAALYARVSTEEQSYLLQLTEVRSYAQRMGWDIVEYTEKMSAVKQRPVLDQLMDDARLRKIDIVLVWKIDRFGRSLKDFVNNLLLLDSYGVRFVAVTQGIDTDQQNPAGKLLMHILGAVAEFERGIIIDRVQAGLKQHKANYKLGRLGKDLHTRSGKDLPAGRPPRVFRRDLAIQMRNHGASFRAIAEELKVSLGTVVRAIQRVKSGVPKTVQ